MAMERLVGTRLGKYELRREIGLGGMGVRKHHPAGGRRSPLDTAIPGA